MSAAASGGLVGVGAGEGWLHTVPAADTDLVFGMLCEEWGLLIALLAVVSIVTLALFAARACRVGRSAFYTIAACAAGCGLIAYGGWWLIAVGAACVLFAFLYTAGPYPLAYHGWGDMLVLLFFGFVPVGCTYYVLCGGWTWQVAVVAAACGLVIDTLLMVNNYRDREQDARSGKRTLVVRLGERAGQRLYLLSGFAAAALCLGLWGDGRTWAALLPLLYLPPHVAAWRRMIRIGRGRELNAVLGATSRNILLFGLLLTLGLLL